MHAEPPRLFVRGGMLVRVKHDEAGARDLLAYPSQKLPHLE